MHDNATVAVHGTGDMIRFMVVRLMAMTMMIILVMMMVVNGGGGSKVSAPRHSYLNRFAIDCHGYRRIQSHALFGSQALILPFACHSGFAGEGNVILRGYSIGPTEGGPMLW